MRDSYVSPIKDRQSLELIISKSTFLGEGRSGKVFLMPDGKALKICKSIKNCIDECLILNKVKGNKYFPIIYEWGINYMIRDYVGGVCLPDYIKENGFSYKLALNLIKLIEEFKKLEFTRLDMRCRHIYVQKDESVMVIDPRAHFTKKVKYPQRLSKGLAELDVLDDFMFVLKEERPKLFKNWKKYIKEYKYSFFLGF